MERHRYKGAQFGTRRNEKSNHPGFGERQTRGFMGCELTGLAGLAGLALWQDFCISGIQTMKTPGQQPPKFLIARVSNVSTENSRPG